MKQEEKKKVLSASEPVFYIADATNQCQGESALLMGSGWSAKHRRATPLGKHIGD